MKLNHLHLNVPDVAKARSFYERYFGFKFKFKHGEGLFLESPDGFLLAIDPHGAGDTVVEFPNWFHFGFCLDNPESVKSLYNRMEFDGVKFYRKLKDFGSDATNFYCCAPGDYRLEVSWNRADE